MKLQGVIPPLLTIFDTDGRADLGATRRLARYLSKHVHALFVCGTYGSGPLMTVDQRKEVLEAVMGEVGPEIPVISHVGSTNTATAMELAKHAEASGVTAVAAVPPYYLKHGDENVLRYFADLVSSVTVPVYVYNNPKTVGYAVTPALLAKLEAVGVRGVKDSSFDITMVDEFRAATSPDFDIVLGTEVMFLPAYILGIRAFVPGLANAFPEVIRALYDACCAGDLERARQLHNQVFQLRKLAHQTGYSSVGVIEMLHLRGFAAGNPPPPFSRIDEGLRSKLKEDMTKVLGSSFQLRIQ